MTTEEQSGICIYFLEYGQQDMLRQTKNGRPVFREAEIKKYYGYNKAKIFEILFYDHIAITTQFNLLE